MFESVVDDAEVGPFAALFAADEPRVYELLHVVRDRGLGERQRFGEVLVNLIHLMSERGISAQLAPMFLVLGVVGAVAALVGLASVPRSVAR